MSSSPWSDVEGWKTGWFGGPAPPRYVYTRSAFLRAIGFIYAVAFLILILQLKSLIGEQGLLPASAYIERLVNHHGGVSAAFAKVPTFFYWAHSDIQLLGFAWLGLGLSLAVMLGVENALAMFFLWAIYMSFVHVGQTWYSFGWEILLLETGFLCIFLCPLRSWRPYASEPPIVVIWMTRWCLFRLMFGAGLIKLRGDDCWTELTCLSYHYETQPNPHPLSWLFHQAPLWFHKLSLLFNHFVELVVPFGLFGPRRLRRLAAVITIGFQATIILSGNLSFLNWLAIALCIPCLDDDFLERFIPTGIRAAQKHRVPAPHSPLQRLVLGALVLLVMLLSLGPIANMLSRRAKMNASFDPLNLVNTYGAFGSVTRVRDEVILQGTSDSNITSATVWQELEFHCKPGNIMRRPCLITPYHYRIDWQMWFAGFGGLEAQPWLAHLMYKWLQGAPLIEDLVETNPFQGGAPKFVRAARYRYHFTSFGEAGWWTREPMGSYSPTLHLKHRAFVGGLRRFGWAR